MACDKKSTGIVLEGCQVYFGKKNKTCVTPVYPVVESSSFKFSTPSTKYYCWIDDGAGVDPVFAGYTAIEVDTSAATTTAEVVTALKTAVEAIALDVRVTISTDTLSATFENASIGVVLEASVDVDSTFVIGTDVAGIGGDLGKTEALDMSMEVETFDVSANQSGNLVLDKFITGLSAEISTTLLQMTAENWSLLVGEGTGGNFTPSGGETVTGYGTDSINKSFFNIAGELRLHPLRLADDDLSRDITLHQCVVQPASINFDSTEKQGMEVSFTALLDETKNGAINLFAFGDSSQNLLK
tara:strand:- start:2321 stop:3217 length:897 start_codon:yes stop_codon:yes gene_type:complete